MMEAAPKLLERPDLFLLLIFGGLLVFVLLSLIIALIASGGARRRFMREIFTNALPSIDINP